MYGPKEIIDDTDSERIAALPITQLHRNVDVELVEADKQGMDRRVGYSGPLIEERRVCQDLYCRPRGDIWHRHGESRRCGRTAHAK